MSAGQRLGRILADERIRGFNTFGAGAPVVCLTESTKAAVTLLVAERRYEPCGIGFSKQFVFNQGAAPAIYVRGDEWPQIDALPQPLRSRAVRFWPGAVPEGAEVVPQNLTRSEWLHEREWRVPGDLDFGWDDVGFVIVPDAAWYDSYIEDVRYLTSPLGEEMAGQYVHWFSAIPVVVMDAFGNVIADESGVWG